MNKDKDLSKEYNALHIANVRRSAMEWWNNIKGEQYPMIVKHSNIISGGANRHPKTLSGSEIESMYRLEHYA